MKVVTSVILTDKEPIKTDEYNGLKLYSILKAVCKVNEVDVYDVKGKRRWDDLATARREYSYMARQLTINSLAEIGAEINKDHSTVLHHNRKVENWLGIESYHLKEKLKRIEEELKL